MPRSYFPRNIEISGNGSGHPPFLTGISWIAIVYRGDYELPFAWLCTRSFECFPNYSRNPVFPGRSIKSESYVVAIEVNYLHALCIRTQQKPDKVCIRLCNGPIPWFVERPHIQFINSDVYPVLFLHGRLLPRSPLHP